ncbi:probable receptor-like protein kinase At2g42960 [Oryza brachyantha]|uniref:non-specific serine/threonine protein kinase n=1 Tax=Oryza brachyantha TaxID=4533 RepID=J3L1M8_ORYBR|nr:probable receptor-like protein kinase At2g42960 [Oryza brachyantha]
MATSFTMARGMKMSTGENLQAGLLSRTPPFGLRLWIVLGIIIWAAILFVAGCICFFLIYWRKRGNRFGDVAEPEIPDVTKEIAVDEVRNRAAAENIHGQETQALSLKEMLTRKSSRKMLAHFLSCKSSDNHNLVGCSSMYQNDKAQCSYPSDEGTSGHNEREYSQYAATSISPQLGLPEFSHLGWGHWFTLRDLEHATDGFSDDNIIGEGGYGVVYHGHLINGTDVAVKKLFNNIGQAEKEFRVEVESIGHVRHKNLVRLLGYCIEGSYRMLVYEYVNNGNLEQWLHGAMSQHGVLTWEARIKIILGIAKALAYLHEGIEPKVIHRDIKSSNILIDKDFTGKLSDFGLSKLLGTGKSHITTRVMGTFGYVAPEYANTGMLNEKSDVYSFGVLLLEAVTGRDPINYGRPTDEVHLLEWIKLMASSRRAEEVVDPAMEARPTKRQLRRVLVAALKCVDPKADKRPSMGSVVRMLEADDVAPSISRQDRRSPRGQCGDGDASGREPSGTSARYSSTAFV